MPERYIQNSYNDVTGLISFFMQSYPDEGVSLLSSLNQVYVNPDVGDEIFQEEKAVINKILLMLSTKRILNENEELLLADAQALLTDIECQITYISGVERIDAQHTLKYNFDYLKDLSFDATYQKSLLFMEDKVNELFKNRFGTMPGTIIFHSALDVMLSFYYYSLLVDDLDSDDRNNIPVILYDIAKNINKHACKYLEQKEEIFTKFTESYSK